jgi:nucleoside-diphosphate-sugar epimerase
VANVVEANLRACVVPGISGAVINVACGTSTSVNEIVEALNEILHTQIRPVHAPRRPGDVRTTYASIEKLRRLLKMKRIIRFDDGLRLTVEWFRRKKWGSG